MSDIVESLRKAAFRGPTMEAAHTKDIRWEAADLIERLTAERDAADTDELISHAVKSAYARGIADERERAAKAAHQAWLDGVPVAEIAATIRALKEKT